MIPQETNLIAWKDFEKKIIEQATRIINYEKKEMILLTNKENKSYEKQKVCYICKKTFSTDDGNGFALNNVSKSKRSLSLHRKM